MVKRRKKPNVMLIIVVLLLVGLVGWNYYARWQVSQLSLATVRQGWVLHEKQVKTIFANTEVILTAGAEGKLSLMQEEGKRYKKGEVVAKIIPSGIDRGQAQDEVMVTAPIAGLFYTKRDKLEEVITPENFMNMDLAKLVAQAEAQVEAAQKALDVSPEILKKNAALGKMVNNLYPSWVFVYLDEKDSLTKGDTVRFKILEEEYAGTVMKVSGEPKGAVVRFSQYIKGTTENRVQTAIWSFKPATKGMLVPIGALDTRGEERGVYIGDDGFIRFTNVRVIDQNDTMACVEGLPEGATVITNPKEGIDGLTLNKRN